MAALAVAMMVMFRLQMSTAGTADRRPKMTAGRSELYAYHPEHAQVLIWHFHRSRPEEVYMVNWQKGDKHTPGKLFLPTRDQ
jgi:hypothetical protein